MDLSEATRVLLARTAGHTELRRQVQLVHDDVVAGRPVRGERLLAVVGDAADSGVLTAMQDSDPVEAEEMTVALIMEIDRQAPDPVRV